MGGKKKNGKQNGKRSGDGKKKKDSGETLTFKEAVLTYQVEVKQSQLSDLKEDVDDLKYRNEKQRQRNIFLKKEQSRHVKDVINIARTKEAEAKNEPKTPFDDVEKSLFDQLHVVKIEENSLQDAKKQIEDLNAQITFRSSELHQILNYKEHGQVVDKTHIELLKKEMEDMQESYKEMAGFFERSLEGVKHSITKQNEENITKQKKIASERAVQNMDKHSEQEFLDNEWLRREVEINRRHAAFAEQEVDQLEKLNIEVISLLFENQLEDVQATRQFYLACKMEEELDRKTKTLTELQNFIEIEANDETEEEDEEIFVQDGEIRHEEQIPDDLKWLDEYFPEFGPNQDDYKLDPMEVKLLCVTGHKVFLHNVPQDTSVPNKKDLYKKWIVEREDLTFVCSSDCPS